MKKTFRAFLMCMMGIICTTVFCLIAVISVSKERNYGWDGVSVIQPKGEGTIESPFIISCPEELAFVAQKGEYNIGDHYLLTKDIDLGGRDWTGIGKDAVPFMGNFNGDGHTIKNIGTSANGFYKSGAQNPSLFGAVSNAFISDLNVQYAFNNASKMNGFGGIANRAVNYVSIVRCGNLTKELTFEDVDNNQSFGGLVGTAYLNCRISNSYSLTNLKVLGGEGNVAGLVGTFKINSGNSIENSFASGTLTADADIIINELTNETACTVSNSYLINDENKETAYENLATISSWELVNNEISLVKSAEKKQIQLADEWQETAVDTRMRNVTTYNLQPVVKYTKSAECPHGYSKEYEVSIIEIINISTYTETDTKDASEEWGNITTSNYVANTEQYEQPVGNFKAGQSANYEKTLKYQGQEFYYNIMISTEACEACLSNEEKIVILDAGKGHFTDNSNSMVFNLTRVAVLPQIVDADGKNMAFCMNGKPVDLTTDFDLIQEGAVLVGEGIQQWSLAVTLYDNGYKFNVYDCTIYSSSTYNEPEYEAFCDVSGIYAIYGVNAYDSSLEWGSIFELTYEPSGKMVAGVNFTYNDENSIDFYFTTKSITPCTIVIEGSGGASGGTTFENVADYELFSYNNNESHQSSYYNGITSRTYNVTYYNTSGESITDSFTITANEGFKLTESPNAIEWNGTTGTITFTGTEYYYMQYHIYHYNAEGDVIYEDNGSNFQIDDVYINGNTVVYEYTTIDGNSNNTKEFNPIGGYELDYIYIGDIPNTRYPDDCGSYEDYLVIEFYYKPKQVREKIEGLKDSFVYNGEEQTPFDDIRDKIDWEYVYSSEDEEGTTATNVGTYTAIATPYDGYCWSDNSYDPVEIEWYITRQPISVPEGAKLEYNGNEQTAYTNSEYITWEDEVSGTSVNEYTATATPTSNYCWDNEDKDSDPLGVTWEIIPKPISVPESKELEYNGYEQTAYTNSEYITWKGDTSGKDVGTYTATAELAEGYVWEDDNTTDPVEIVWYITPQPIPVPDDNQVFTYNGEVQNPFTDYSEDQLSIDYGTTSTINIGDYSATVTPTSNYCWDNEDKDRDPVNISWSISAIDTVAKPTVPGPFTYNGEVQSPFTNSQYITWKDDTEISGKDAGTYTATAELAEGYVWEDDNTTDPVNVEWEIIPKQLTVTVMCETSKEYDGNTNVYGEITVEYDGVCDGDKIEVESNSIEASYESAEVGENILITVSWSYNIIIGDINNYVIPTQEEIFGEITLPATCYVTLESNDYNLGKFQLDSEEPTGTLEDLEVDYGSTISLGDYYIAIGEITIYIVVSPDEGYEVEFELDENSQISYITEDTTITVNFTQQIKQFDLIIKVNEDDEGLGKIQSIGVFGSQEVSSVKETVDWGTEINISSDEISFNISFNSILLSKEYQAVPEEIAGYTVKFASWSSDISLEGTILITGNTTFTANFIKTGNDNFINFNTDGGEEIPEVRYTTTDVKQQISLPTPSKQGFDFIYWSIDDSASDENKNTHASLYNEHLDIPANTYGDIYLIATWTESSGFIYNTGDPNDTWHNSSRIEQLNGEGDSVTKVTSNQILSISFVNEEPKTYYSKANITGSSEGDYWHNEEILTAYYVANSGNYDVKIYGLGDIILPLNSAYIFANLTALKSIDLTNLITSDAININYMFMNCEKLSSITWGNDFTTENVKSMIGTFSGCKALTSLNSSCFDTANVTDMSSMFTNCEKLSSIIWGNGFTTENVTNINNMFNNCKALTSLNLSCFNTANVTDMSWLFANCIELTEITISESFNTANVTKMNSMFRGCKKLESSYDPEATSLDTNVPFPMFANGKVMLNTEGVTTMRYMFSNCSAVEYLDLSEFDTSEVTDMCGMFENCSNLTTLNLTSFDTSKVKTMFEMFVNCSKLTELDLTNFNLGATQATEISISITDTTGVDRMLYGCVNLAIIYSPSELNSQEITLPQTASSGFYVGEGTDRVTVIVEANTDYIRKFKVTYNANGGTGEDVIYLVNYGENHTIKCCTFVNSGKTFAGWTKILGSASVEYNVNDDLGCFDDTILYAVWNNGGVELSLATITFVLSNEATAPSPLEIAIGTTLDLDEAGYTELEIDGDTYMVEWYDDEGAFIDSMSFAPILELEVTESITLYGVVLE